MIYFYTVLIALAVCVAYNLFGYFALVVSFVLLGLLLKKLSGDSWFMWAFGDMALFIFLGTIFFKN